MEYIGCIVRNILHVLVLEALTWILCMYIYVTANDDVKDQTQPQNYPAVDSYCQQSNTIFSNTICHLCLSAVLQNSNRYIDSIFMENQKNS